ncbi:MAG TPA: DsbA family protein [Myxococcota bacterium]|nr:DsbA family protein [Myxococcota bacterium]
MPSLARRLAPWAMAALTSPRTRALRRALARTTRRLRGRRREVHYFHQVDDPYSALAAQRLRAFAERYDVTLVPHLVAPPSDAAAPERALLEAFARRDAADVAPAHGLAFPASADPPARAQVARAQRVLCRALHSPVFVDEAMRVSGALWSADARELDSLASTLGEASEREAERELAAGSALRERLGHYLGATFHYEGEWYWGVDRLHHLERRLREEGALKERARDHALVAPRPIARATPPAAAPAAGARAPLVLEFFASLRSPYTYIVTERVLALAKQTGAQLVLRPVLPMVMRGLPVPRAKQLYIALDTKREAEDAGVPFGRVCDPVGRPVERAFSLYPFARERGRAPELLLEFMRASWAEGIDTGSDAGLRRVVERAGLSWNEAQQRVDRDESWRAELEANRAELFALGLWGVPSFRVRGGAAPDYATWGQDRLWRVEEEIRARIAS